MKSFQQKRHTSASRKGYSEIQKPEGKQGFRVLRIERSVIDFNGFMDDSV